MTTRAIDLTVRDTQWDEAGKPHSGSTRVRAALGMRADDPCIAYAEHLPEAGDTQVRVYMRADCVQIQRDGAYGALLTFREGTREATRYHTPYGALDMVAEAQIAAWALTDGGGTLTLRYTLWLGGGAASRHAIDMTWRRVTEDGDV